jgi:hypothetical protein
MRIEFVTIAVLPQIVPRPLADGLVDVQVALVDFQVESAGRVGANPGLERHRRAFLPIVGQWHQDPRTTLLTPGPDRFHRHITPPSVLTTS